MKKIINFTYAPNPEVSLKNIKQAGFGGIFLYANPYQKKYFDIALNLGLKIDALFLSHNLLNENNNIIDSDFINIIWEKEKQSNLFLNKILNEIEFAHNCNINKVIMSVAGEKSRPKKTKNGIIFINKILKKCEEYNIKLCLKNPVHLEYLDYILENIKSENLKFCFDTGNANLTVRNINNFPFEKYGSCLEYLNISDNDGFLNERKPPFYGQISWKKLIKIISKYNNCLNYSLNVYNHVFSNDREEVEFLNICAKSLDKIEKLILPKYAIFDNYIDTYPYSYIYYERYVNNGSISGFSSKSTSKKTCPKSIYNYVSLIDILNPTNNKIITYGNLGNFIDFNHILIHPDLCSNSIKNKKYVKAYPTASGRTLLINNRYNGSYFFVKLPYPDYIGRIIRDIDSEKIRSSIEVNNLMKKAVDKGLVSQYFSFLKEDGGVTLTINNDLRIFNNKNKKAINSNSYEYGILKREFLPYPYSNEEEYLIPAFSLFSKNLHPYGGGLSEQPVLIQLFKKQRKQFSKFLLEDVILPIFTVYFECLIYCGVELEAHSQNILVSIDKNFHIKRVVCRDLESAGRDIPLLKTIEGYKESNINYKRNDILPKNPDQKYAKYYITHSFMFDFKLGEYLITQLINCGKEYDSTLDVAELQRLIKKYNAKYINMLPKDFFPPDWCYYENINFNKTGKKRIYVWNENPKYR